MRPAWRNSQHRDRPDLASSHSGFLDTKRGFADRVPLPKGIKKVKAPSGGIPARVGFLIGKATCDVWTTGSTDRTISDSGKNIDVYNLAKTAVCVNGDRFGYAAFDYDDQKWYLISEFCDDDEPGVGSQPLGITEGTTDSGGVTGLIRTTESAPLPITEVAPLDDYLGGFQSGSGGLPPGL